jgi:F-type H+-transporting ATPase subunit epsilon
MIAVFDIGSLILTTEDGNKITFATSGGFLEVVDNYVTVLAETAEPGTAIDIQRAKEAEERAVAALRSGNDRAEAERALKRARNRLRVAIGAVGSERSGENFG